jgi:D-sedoheptulose 7-phosphate isomerase
MKIKSIIQRSIEVKQRILEDKAILLDIELSANRAAEILHNKGRILLCGNGGSAADAQHIAAELSGRFSMDRDPLDAEALHVNSSFITAVANDYSFEDVYSRMVKAKGRTGDMLVAISTSGNSPNIINAMKTAQDCGMFVVGLSGRDGGQMKDLSDLLIVVPSDETARIQEAHIMIGHIFCQLIEEYLFDHKEV